MLGVTVAVRGGTGSLNTTISSSPVFAATLDRWTAHDWNRGVLIPQLAAQDQILVRTRNTTYEIIVIEPHTATVLVRGGAYFRTLTPARVAGSSLGGGCLKLHGIYPGFQMELMTDDLTGRYHPRANGLRPSDASGHGDVSPSCLTSRDGALRPHQLTCFPAVLDRAQARLKPRIPSWSGNPTAAGRTAYGIPHPVRMWITSESGCSTICGR